MITPWDSSAYCKKYSDGNSTGPPGDPRDEHNNKDLTTQLIISVTLGVVAFFTFVVLRPKWSTLYNARKKRIKAASLIPDLPKAYFGWMLVLYKISEQEVLQSAGLDAYVFLGFYKMAIKFLAVATFLGAAVVLPVQKYFQNKNKISSDTRTVWTEWMEGEKPREDVGYLWMTAVFVYVFTFLAFYFLLDQTKRIISVRQDYLGNQSTITDRTIRLSGVPKELQSEASLKDHVEKLSIGKVEHVSICREWGKLDALMAERMDILRKLEEVWTVYLGVRQVERNSESLPIIQPPPPRPYPPQDNESLSLVSEEHITSSVTVPYERTRPQVRHRFGFLKLKSRKVDAINYFSAKLEKLDLEISELRKTEFKTTPLAFVTMDSVAAAQVTAQAILDPFPLHLIAHLAPAPSDVVWSNTYVSRRSRMIRGWTISLFIAGLTIVWLIPVGALTSLLNLRTICKISPRLADALSRNAVAASLVQQFLPTAGFTLLTVGVPYLYDYMANMQGFISQADVELSVISKNFFFTFFNLFFIFTVGGTAATLWSTLTAGLQDTTEVLRSIATSLESMTSFFTNLIILQGLGMFPLRLLEFGSVAMYPIMLVGCKTPRDYAELVAPPVFKYGFYLPQSMLIFIICLVYSLLDEGTIMLAFGLLYFIMGYFTYKYQLLYAMDHPSHSTGQAWPIICNRVILGLVFFQMAMAGFLVTKLAFTRAAILIPLIIATVWFSWFFQKTYLPLNFFIALRSIKENENEDPTFVITVDEEREEGMQFVNPSLTEPLQRIWLENMQAYETENGGNSSRDISNGSSHRLPRYTDNPEGELEHQSSNASTPSNPWR